MYIHAKIKYSKNNKIDTVSFGLKVGHGPWGFAPKNYVIPAATKVDNCLEQAGCMGPLRCQFANGLTEKLKAHNVIMYHNVVKPYFIAHPININSPSRHLGMVT